MFNSDSENYHNEVEAAIKDTGEIFSDKFSVHFFELKKMSRKPDPKNRKELWLQYINADKEELALMKAIGYSDNVIKDILEL